VENVFEINVVRKVKSRSPQPDNMFFKTKVVLPYLEDVSVNSFVKEC